MDVEKKNEILTVVEKMREEIQKFKKNGYSAAEIRKIINRCYILNELNNAIKKDLLSKEKIEIIINHIAYKVDKEIRKRFYEKFSRTEYFAPKIDKIHVDTPYKSKRIGNVIETRFEDVSKVSGKNIGTDYNYDGESCNLHQEFTEDGSLITTCKKDVKEERD